VELLPYHERQEEERMEKDICAKEFFSDGARYADIINGLGCSGRRLA
jgi:uncharacterized protein YjcR